MLAALHFLFLDGLACYPDSYCELTGGIAVLFSVGSAVVAALLIACGLWLRAERLKLPISLGICALAAAGGVAALLDADLAASQTFDDWRSVLGYQVFSALPLALWPVVGVMATLVLGVLSARHSWRWLGLVWPAVAIVISLFALTYLLPATDPHVAAWHGSGVARFVGYIEEVRGGGDTGFLQTWIRMPDAVELTLPPGSYTVLEWCPYPPDTTRTPYTIKVPFQVTRGEVTAVPNRCSG